MAVLMNVSLHVQYPDVTPGDIDLLGQLITAFRQSEKHQNLVEPLQDMRDRLARMLLTSKLIPDAE